MASRLHRDVDGRQGPAATRGDQGMSVATIAGKPVHVDEEGFLTDPTEWDEELAKTLASNIGIELTERHWAAIQFPRRDYTANG
ncbi:MAG: TusE/DsrC/DsvC family sulfur relay protein, partial [Actinomycetota bacterium]